MSVEGSHLDADGCAENAAPYVLGALTEEEHEQFRAHLKSCAICREEVAALQVVASTLPMSVAQTAAPVDLKRRVMATVHQEASLHGTLDSAEPARTRRSPRGWVGGLGWRPALAGAAVAALVVALVAVSLSSGGGATPTRVYHAEVAVPHAAATLRVSAGHAELDIADLPQAPPNRVYEVWVKRGGAPEPTDALFTVSSSGAATVGVPGDVTGATAIMVTAEPRGGSSAPTSAPVLVARLS